MNLISFELLRNLPLVPSKLFNFQHSLAHTISPKSQLDPTIQTKLFSKFPEEVIEALQIIIAVWYFLWFLLSISRSLLKEIMLNYSQKSSVCFLMIMTKLNVWVNILLLNSVKSLKTRVLWFFPSVLFTKKFSIQSQFTEEMPLKRSHQLCWILLIYSMFWSQLWIKWSLIKMLMSEKSVLLLGLRYYILLNESFLKSK